MNFFGAEILNFRKLDQRNARRLKEFFLYFLFLLTINLFADPGHSYVPTKYHRTTFCRQDFQLLLQLVEASLTKSNRPNSHLYVTPLSNSPMIKSRKHKNLLAKSRRCGNPNFTQKTQQQYRCRFC